MSIQVEKFENSHIYGSRSFRVFIRAILANVRNFRNVGYSLFSAFRNFAVLYKNESSSSVDIHLVKTISVHLG